MTIKKKELEDLRKKHLKNQVTRFKRIFVVKWLTLKVPKWSKK
jgi:hypothetical protein